MKLNKVESQNLMNLMKKNIKKFKLININFYQKIYQLHVKGYLLQEKMKFLLLNLKGKLKDLNHNLKNLNFKKNN